MATFSPSDWSDQSTNQYGNAGDGPIPAEGGALQGLGDLLGGDAPADPITWTNDPTQPLSPFNPGGYAPGAQPANPAPSKPSSGPVVPVAPAPVPPTHPAAQLSMANATHYLPYIALGAVAFLGIRHFAKKHGRK